MSKNDFYKNSFLLTLANLATGVLSFIFSICLSKLLGPEGMGLYGLVMPIYNLFICLMTAGVVAAISKITAIYEDSNDYSNILKTMKTVAFFNFIWAFFIGILVFFFSPAIGNLWVKDPRTIKAIMVTCPAMVCIALSNILKGYFYGSSKITMPAFIDILEKGFRILLLVVLIYILKAKELETLVTLAYVAMCLGEFQSLFLLFVYFKYTIRHTAPLKRNKTESKAQLLFDVLVTSIPLCLNGFLVCVFSTISTLLVPRRFLVAGFSYFESLSLIGKYCGMSLAIVTFPLIIISSINTLLIPDLSQTINKKDFVSAKRRIKEVILIAFLIGIATTIICQCIPDSLGSIFFNRDDLGKFIKTASLSMPLLFTASTMFGILNGLNKQTIILRNTIITEIIEIISLFILTAIPSINVFGYAITMFLVSLLTLILNLFEVNKTICLDLSFFNIIIFILFGVFIYFLMNILYLKTSFIDYRLQALLISLLTSFIFVFIIIKFRRLYYND